MPESFKTRMKRGDRLLGFFVGTPSPAVVEMAGLTGYDFVIIDTEHGPADIETIENMLRAAAQHGMAGLVRVPDGSVASIQRVLDAGADGILVPHVSSAAIAREVVERALFAPQGKRGVALSRSILRRRGQQGVLRHPQPAHDRHRDGRGRRSDASGGRDRHGAGD